MRTLISPSSKPHFPYHFPSLSYQNRKPNFYLHREWLLKPQNNTTICISLSSSCSANSAPSYNGWDDFRIRVDSHGSGESNFLTLLGIDDKKYVFTCILGFVCALAISRVRVSSIIVFPAAAIVFAIGFSFGFVNGRPSKGLSLNGAKRREKGDYWRVYGEKMKVLVDIFDGFDVKVSKLKDDIKKAIDCERVEVGDLEGYVNVVESIGGLVSNARNVVEDCIDHVSSDGQEMGKNLYQKKNGKKKEIANNGFNLFEFMGGFLGDNAAGSRVNRTTFVRGDGKDADTRGRDHLRGSMVEERASNSVSTKDDGEPNMRTSGYTNGKNTFGDRNEEVERIGKMNSMEEYMSAKAYCDDDEFKYQSRRFMNNRRVSLNTSSYRETRKWASNDSMSSYSEFDVSKRHVENEVYESSRGRENDTYESYRTSFKEEKMNVEDEFHSRKYQSKQEDAVRFSSAGVSDDVLFDKCLRKADDLLKEAKECFKDDEMLVEEMLYESAKLLSKAIAMKPMSLLAVGQLGNTYLLHGELKLKISRELRSLLSRNDDLSVKRRTNLITPVDEILPSKDRTATLLVDVCEECETLLVEAGRKYRMALSIDGNDVRAMYNWGLALFFRAQLIADIGPEAAVDADKLFLAAIDKFDAMMSRSNAYAPEALFRWGATLQQRSRLRPSDSRDKVKLLQQAKRLYEDALEMGSNSLQVKEALSSCMSELDFSNL